MSEQRDDRDYLEDIVEAIERIQIYVEGFSYDRFVQDTKTQDAVIRNLEVIGEAAKQVSDTLREQRPEIPWREVCGVRDKLIHHYFGINFETLWQIIETDLAPVLSQIRDILQQLPP